MPDGFWRYAAAAASGLALSLLLISAYFVGGSRSLVDNLRTALFSVWFVWGSVAVFALAPGWRIFRRIRRAYRANRAEKLIGILLASVSVAVVSAVGAVTVLWLWALLTGDLGGGSERLGGLLFVMLVPGVPSAVLSGLAFYAWEDSRAI